MVDKVLIQRFYPNFREGLFDLLADRVDYRLLCHTKSFDKIKVPQSISSKEYVWSLFSITFKNGVVVFPFLFFTLCYIRPKTVITEGGSNTVNNLSVWLYTFLFNKEYILWDLGKDYMTPQAKISYLRKRYNKLYEFLIKKASKVYVYNSQGKNYFKDKYSISDVVNLKNTVDTSLIDKMKKSFRQEEFEQLTRRFKLFKSIALYVGALNSEKNLENFKEFVELLPTDHALIIIGSGDPTYVANLKMTLSSKNVFFEGYKGVAELLYYYKISSYLILPGLGGLSINQAMAYGVPVICTHADGSEIDLVQNGLTGYIYSTIPDAIEFITNQTNESWCSMGKRAENLLMDEFSICDMAFRFINGVENVTNA